MLIRALAVTPRSQAQRLRRLLSVSDVSLDEATGRDGWQRVGEADWDLVFVDRSRLGGSTNARLRAWREPPHAPEVVVLVRNEDPHDRAALLAAGALAIVNGDLPDEAMTETLRALALRSRESGLQRLRAERIDRPGSLADFVSESPAMRRFISIARRMIDVDASLLVLGETGVGKERLARALHDEGPRRAGPFIAVNCGALTESLLESELFGHEEGAYTGAIRSRRGFFELAHGGTLFLDEVGDMPLSLQVKVLRTLQDLRVTRVGGEREITVDVRVIAATNRDLGVEMREGRFRADLFYRLSVVSLVIPPLRERATDIPTLVANHIGSASRRSGRHALRVDEATMATLARYQWPGNVRELINVLERACLLADGDTITLTDLPESISVTPTTDPPATNPARTSPPDVPLAAARERVLEQFERSYLIDALRRTRGRVGDTAGLAGISERALYTKMRRYGLDKTAFRTDSRGGGRAATEAAGEHA